ncbi:MAG: hypothetical protein PXY39_12910 [archaeon]|nr:hypothetical protein [archaeon]
MPSNLPFPTTTTGFVVAMGVFTVMTLLVRRATRSRWSWMPALVMGLVAGSIIH